MPNFTFNKKLYFYIMTTQPKLFMAMLGCRPKGRYTEQHDIFFGIGHSFKELIPAMKSFWPEAKGNIHVDVWREVTTVDGCTIEVVPNGISKTENLNLFFINLGGYKENEFDEFHYKIVTVAENLSDATKKAKVTSFYKHCGFKGATSHIDDKFGIDVDDIFTVKEILSPIFTDHYDLRITKNSTDGKEDELHIGYLKLAKIE